MKRGAFINIKQITNKTQLFVKTLMFNMLSCILWGDYTDRWIEKNPYVVWYCLLMFLHTGFLFSFWWTTIRITALYCQVVSFVKDRDFIWMISLNVILSLSLGCCDCGLVCTVDYLRCCWRSQKNLYKVKSEVPEIYAEWHHFIKAHTHTHTHVN